MNNGFIGFVVLAEAMLFAVSAVVVVSYLLRFAFRRHTLWCETCWTRQHSLGDMWPSFWVMVVTGASLLVLYWGGLI